MIASTPPGQGNVHTHLRDELQALESLQELDSQALNRLLFLFRASDPGIYQSAAAELGRRSVMEPEAERTLYNYAQERGVDIARTIRLDGLRSTRRILYATSRAWLARPPDHRGPPPLANEMVAAGLPDSPADAAVLLQVTAELLSARTIDGLGDAAETLLLDLPSEDAGRMVWRRWTELLFAIRAYGVPTQVPACTGAWRDALERLVITADDTPFLERSRRLIALDELFRIAGQHPDALQELSAAWPHAVPEPDRRWCRLRFATWCRRHYPNHSPLLTVEPREYVG